MWASKYWREILIGVLSLLLSLSTIGWVKTAVDLGTEKSIHQLDNDNFKAAQKAADKKAQDARDKIEKEGKAKADEADKNYINLLAEYRANLVRYKANPSYPSRPYYSELPSAQSGNGPSSGPEVPATVTILESDAQICATNTARLVVVRDWAIQLPK